MNDLIFNNGNIVEWEDDGYYECICADNVSAVFVPCIFLHELKGATLHSEYRNMFVVSNTDRQAISNKYKIIR